MIYSSITNYSSSSRNVGYIFMWMGILVLCSMLALDQPWNSETKLWSLSLVFFLIGDLFSFTHEGIMIDHEKSLIKSYVSIFNIKLGRWKKLPVFTKISIIEAKSFYFYESAFSYRRFCHTVTTYKVFLKNETLKVVVSVGSKEKVLEDAEYLSKNLGLPIIKRFS